MFRMIALKIIFGIISCLAYVSLMTTMIILERDKPKNIIIWSIVFLLSQFIGYVVYLLIRHVFYKKRNSFIVKQKEDEIYDNLISNQLSDNKADCEQSVFNFNSLAFNTHTTTNNVSNPATFVNFYLFHFSYVYFFLCSLLQMSSFIYIFI